MEFDSGSEPEWERPPDERAEMSPTEAWGRMVSAKTRLSPGTHHRRY